MFREFVEALFLIFMAEMGDKTQILAMTFATQFTVSKVLLGVFIGSFLNHGIAVLVGSYLSRLIPINLIQIIAGFLFIGFALWTLKDDDEEKDENNNKNLGPVLTVSMAFFIGELGDKTQLTAITLSIDSAYPFFVLIGTVTGMILTSGLGIFIGSKIGNRIPEFTLKILSAAIFMFFGISKLYNTLPDQYINIQNVLIFFSVLSFVTYLIIKPTLRKRKETVSLYKEVAADLYEYTHLLKKTIADICLGEKQCGDCKGDKCVIGYIKSLLNGANIREIEGVKEIKESLGKNFSKNRVVEALSIAIYYLTIHNKNKEDFRVINKIREALETILFDEKLIYNGDINDYFKLLKTKDKNVAKRIKKRIEYLKRA
ncbi:TMEM165/GDT1 family protein [Thermohalobacter berrensis]|uniref:GDT1 family protein n=1 Tax=Thermohalobacter berrensis TaxID=99594 RepID=A0A419SZ48_9FIRM|nr:TMEM165/GDT1 family protein [Thermohalobacter berrensis]RKD30543.1 hypothetical protein BET03_04180 [Thermohalobacter berrensis]